MEVKRKKIQEEIIFLLNNKVINKQIKTSLDKIINNNRLINRKIKIFLQRIINRIGINLILLDKIIKMVKKLIIPLIKKINKKYNKMIRINKK